MSSSKAGTLLYFSLYLSACQHSSFSVLPAPSPSLSSCLFKENIQSPPPVCHDVTSSNIFSFRKGLKSAEALSLSSTFSITEPGVKGWGTSGAGCGSCLQEAHNLSKISKDTHRKSIVWPHHARCLHGLCWAWRGRANPLPGA